VFSNEKQEIRQFVSSVYRNYQNSPDYNCYGLGADTIFAHELFTLFEKDREITPEGDVGYLDYMVLCSCQDVDGLHVDKIDIHKTANQYCANVSLSFAHSPDKVSLQLLVVKMNTRWYISDIITDGTESLVKNLKSYILKYSGKTKNKKQK